MSTTEFLTARYDEDEAVARAATAGPWQWWNLEGVDQGWSDNGPNLETVARGIPDEDGEIAKETVIGAWGHDAWGIVVEPEDAAHIARHDPSRALADIAAKRRIVEMTAVVRGLHDPVAEAQHMLVLGHLASVFAEHPDYFKGWKP